MRFNAANMTSVVLTTSAFTTLCAARFPAPCIADQPREIAKRCFPSTVLLGFEDANRQLCSLGSGFVVDAGVIATNFHVVEGATSGYAKLIGENQKHNIVGYFAIDSKRDLILLSVPTLKAPKLSLGDCEKVDVGDAVYVVGNPQGLEGTFSAGIVSGIRKIEDDKIIQLTAPISPGSSGGPVIDERGKVIGIAFAAFQEGQNLNFAVPSNYLRDLQKKAGKDLKPIRDSTGKREKAILSSVGEPAISAVIGTHLLWQNNYSGQFSFSLRNQLRQPVKDVVCMVVFFDKNDDPVEVSFCGHAPLIPAGLARRVESEVDDSVKKLTTREKSYRLYEEAPATKVEVRILDFTIVE